MAINETPFHAKLRQLTQTDSGVVLALDQKALAYLFCDACQFYPIQPENAHYKCPNCGARTSCCEGAPA